MNTLLFDKAPGRAPLGRALTPWYKTTQVRHTADPYSMSFGEFRQVKVVRENAACWANHERVPGTKEGTEGSCRPKGSGEKKKKKKKRGSKMYKARENASKFPAKGSDADGDGKTGEGKKKITDFSDKNGNGKADVFESSSEYDSGSESEGEMQVSVTESSSDDDGPMKKKRSNASAADNEDCGCGCGGDPEKKKADCGGSGLTKTISKAAKAEKKEKKKKEHVIHRANDGKHDFFVYHRGKKISFGDASMPNKNHSDSNRKSFNARHKCSEKTDRSKAGYWACKVWRKGHKS